MLQRTLTLGGRAAAEAAAAAVAATTQAAQAKRAVSRRLKSIKSRGQLASSGSGRDLLPTLSGGAPGGGSAPATPHAGAQDSGALISPVYPGDESLRGGSAYNGSGHGCGVVAAAVAAAAAASSSQAAACDGQAAAAEGPSQSAAEEGLLPASAAPAAAPSPPGSLPGSQPGSPTGRGSQPGSPAARSLRQESRDLEQSTPE